MDQADFLREARDRYQAARDADQVDRTDALDDTRFHAGHQWSEKDVAARERAARPVLTENRLPTFTAQVVNDGRRNKPAIKCSPLDGGTPETAEYFAARIRQIEYESNADTAYNTAGEQQIICGRGFYRVRTKYCRPRTFQQELRIERIENQFSVLFDPASKEYDRSDAEWCFVVTTMSNKEFERRYGKNTEAVRNNFFSSIENPAPDWFSVGDAGQHVQVAEYWVKQHRKRELLMLETGESVFKDEVPAGVPIGVVDSRVEDDVEVVQYIINGVEILDETPWIGKSIPIVPVWGRETVVDGVLRTISLIRFSKDAQRRVNLYASNIAEQIAQMPKSPYIMAEGQVEGPEREREWGLINLQPKAYVQYKPVAIGEKLAPAPQRVINEPPIQALVIGYNQAVDALKATMGIFDASLGARSNETSGIAIRARQQEGDTSNYHFQDNQARSRRYLGRILLECIPVLERGEKDTQIRTEDGKTRSVRVNTQEPYRDRDTGKMVHYQLDQGAYDVAINTGPSYMSAREHAFDVYSQIAQADKTFMQVAGDVLFRNMDAPGAEQIADRYEQAVIPEQLRSTKPGQEAIPPQVKVQLQKYGELTELLTQRVNELTEILTQKKMEIESRERIAAMQNHAQMVMTHAKIQSTEGIELLRQEIAAVGAQIDQMNREKEMEQATLEAEQEPETANAG